MVPITGLHVVIATLILQIQASHGGVIRNPETTTFIAETTPQVSTIADSTIPQDIIAQTTLPPILFRTDSETTVTGISTMDENPSTTNIELELSRSVLSGSEPQLGGKPSVDTSTMDSDSTLVPTSQLVPVSEPLPDVGGSTMGPLVKVPTTEAVGLQPVLPQEQPTSEGLNQVQQTTTEALTTVKLVQTATPASLLKPQWVAENTLRSKLTPDSFVPPTIQIMAYVIDTLWEKERKNVDGRSYKVAEDVNDTRHEWEDDDMSKPVFQMNVPIVNEESVPMKMHMDIIPQDFPEDLEEPMYYPHYDDDKDTKNDLDKFTGHPWGKDSDIMDPEDIEDDVKENVDKFFKIQQQMRSFRYSKTFEKLVELHKNLVVYARNHNVKIYKKFSDIVTDVLRKNAANAAEQLKTVISMISDEVDDEPLENSFKKFLENISESSSESSRILSSLPALHYS